MVVKKNRIKFYSRTQNKILSETFPETDNFFNNFSASGFPYKRKYIHQKPLTIFFLTMAAIADIDMLKSIENSSA